MLWGLAVLALVQTFPPAWFADVEPGGWTIRTASAQGVMLLTRPHPAGGPRIWVRWEYGPDFEPGILSERILMEVDCEEHRLQMLDRATFSGRNLTGDQIPDDGSFWGWQYAAPDTFNETIVQVHCEGGV